MSTGLGFVLLLGIWITFDHLVPKPVTSYHLALPAKGSRFMPSLVPWGICFEVGHG